MIPLVIALGIFLYWTFLGKAVLALFSRSIGILRSWLLAPGVGFATLFIAVAILNQAGIPIKAFAWGVTISFLIFTIGVFKYRNIIVPVRALGPFFAAIGFSLLWSAWPMFHFGFNWLSYVNDDFTNYCLAAERFKDFGFYRVPSKAELVGVDYAQYYWFMHAIQLMRFGSEHAVAWLSSLTGRPALEVFMPTIISFALAQIFAASALVLAKGRYRNHAKWTAILLSFSPMFIFGSLYQLIAQVSGICLLLCLVVLLTSGPVKRRRGRIALHAISTSIVGAALCVFYPEVTPFACLAVGLYLILKWIRKSELPGAEIVLLQYSIIGIIVLLRYNIISYLYTLCNQFVGGTRRIDLSLSLFPFFLIPSGLASIFGLQAMNQDVANPWGSIVILIGFVLLVLCIIFAVKKAYEGSALGCLLLVELVVSGLLYRTGNDFGLYKAVMFMQPLLMAALAWNLVSIKVQRLIPLIATCLFLLTCSTTLIYTKGSIGAGGGMTGEVSLASQLINNRPKAPKQGTHWLSDIDNVSAAKLVAGFYRGTSISFICRDYFYPVFLPHSDWPYVRFYPNWNQFDQAVNMMTERAKTSFVVKPILGTTFTDVVDNTPVDAYLGQVSELSLFNKINQNEIRSNSLLTLTKPSEIKNRLAFIHSEKGNQYYLGDRRHISYFQQENDYFREHAYFNGIGQFLLLRVENPSPLIFVRIAATKTLMGGGHTEWSSKATLIGERSVTLGAVGSGALNLIVGPLKPVWLDGNAYIAIDFNQSAISVPTHRSWLKALYNSSINLDYRRLVGFGRDISALSLDEYQRLERPRGIASFPSDLVTATGLEFSGVYEDGWLSTDSHFIFGKPELGDQLRIKGYIPELPGVKKSQNILIRVNRDTVYRITAEPGEFDWALPINQQENITQLDITTDSKTVLPDSDLRPVAAHLSYIGLDSKGVFDYDYTRPEQARPIAKNVSQDGWARAFSDVTIPLAQTTQELVLKVEYPGWQDLPQQAEINISDQFNHTTRILLHKGINEIVVPSVKGSHQLNLRFASKKSFTLPAPDLRICAFRLIAITSR